MAKPPETERQKRARSRRITRQIKEFLKAARQKEMDAKAAKHHRPFRHL
jgi:hypothetical protein